MEISQNVKIVGSKHCFYASVIDFKILSQSIELSLDNFGEHEIKKGMVIYQS